MSSAQRWIGVVFVMAVVIAAVVVGRSAAIHIHAASLTFREPRTLVSSQAESDARAEFAGLEDAVLHTADGLTLRGWFVPGRRRAAVVLVHGGWANRLQLLPDARILARLGYGFLVYDSRACGQSDGDHTTWGDREQGDVVAALDFVSARPDIDRDRIGVLGLSIGASTVAMVAARDTRARAVVLYATWTSLEDEIKDKAGKYGPFTWGPVLLYFRYEGVDAGHIRPIDAVSLIAPRPILFVAGGLDDDTPVPVMKRLFAAAGEPKYFWVDGPAPHGGHGAVSPAEYETQLGAFLDRAWAGAPRHRAVPSPPHS